MITDFAVRTAIYPPGVTTTMTSTSLMLLNDDEIDLEEACARIGAAWRTTIDSLFEVILLFRLCLDKKGFRQLQLALEERGIMKRGVFTMFKAIASNPLIDAKIKDRLPAGYNSLYWISKIEDEDLLLECIENGNINTEITTQDAKSLYLSLIGDEREHYESIKPKSEILALASMKVDRTLYRQNKSRILSLITQLGELGVNVKINEGME